MLLSLHGMSRVRLGSCVPVEKHHTSDCEVEISGRKLNCEVVDHANRNGLSHSTSMPNGRQHIPPAMFQHPLENLPRRVQGNYNKARPNSTSIPLVLEWRSSWCPHTIDYSVHLDTRPECQRGFTDLVVDDNMHRAVSGVGWQVAQMERLVHNALASEGSVAVQQDGHHLEDTHPCCGIAGIR